MYNELQRLDFGSEYLLRAGSPIEMSKRKARRCVFSLFYSFFRMVLWSCGVVPEFYIVFHQFLPRDICISHFYPINIF